MSESEPPKRRIALERRRALRQQQTTAEAVLWKYLRKRQCGGRYFRRQHALGPFIVDFYCAEARLVIELDGSVHNDSMRADYDYERQCVLESFGYTVLRIANEDVLKAPEQIALYITEFLNP